MTLTPTLTPTLTLALALTRTLTLALHPTLTLTRTLAPNPRQVRANQIIVLDKGAAVERGTHEELSSDPDSLYSSFMRHQLLSPESGEGQPPPVLT